MADGDLRDQIVRIEVDIDELAKTLDGCRKAMLFSKVAIAAGGIWILANLLGAIRFDCICAAPSKPMVIITMTLERIDHWTKMRRSLAPFRDRIYKFTRDSWRTSSPLRAGLGFRYTHPATGKSGGGPLRQTHNPLLWSGGFSPCDRLLALQLLPLGVPLRRHSR